MRDRTQSKSAKARPDYEGMGLGLFIAKTLLERSGAQLRFTNGTGRNTAKPKCGAVIEVVWPRATLELQPQGETEKMGKNQQITV